MWMRRGKVLTETETERERDGQIVRCALCPSTAHADASVSIHPERRGIKEGRQRERGASEGGDKRREVEGGAARAARVEATAAARVHAQTWMALHA